MNKLNDEDVKALNPPLTPKDKIIFSNRNHSPDSIHN
jgi:hypothetical protein